MSISEYPMPQTEQGLKEYITYGEAEIKRATKRIEKISEMIYLCKQRLKTIEGAKNATSDKS